MTAIRVTQPNGQEAWEVTCDKLTAEGKPCDYKALNNESAAAAEQALLDHQLLRPNEGELEVRPAREIAQHYPHFIGYDLPNAGQEPEAASTTSVTAPSGPPPSTATVESTGTTDVATGGGESGQAQP